MHNADEFEWESSRQPTTLHEYLYAYGSRTFGPYIYYGIGFLFVHILIFLVLRLRSPYHKRLSPKDVAAQRDRAYAEFQTQKKAIYARDEAMKKKKEVGGTVTEADKIDDTGNCQ